MSVESIGQKHKDVLQIWSVFEDENQIRASLVIVEPEHRGQGIGREIFDELNSYADRTGKTIVLSPDSNFGISKNKLIKFYRSLGYVLNRGRNKDYEISDSMYRLPKQQQFNEGLKTLIHKTLDDILKTMDFNAI